MKNLIQSLPPYLQIMVAAVKKQFPLVVTVNGPPADIIIRWNGTPCLNMASPNYLGLSNDPRVCAEAKRAIDKFGLGTNGSRFVTGNLSLFEELEHEVADFMGTESAVVMQDVGSLNRAVLSMLIDPHLTRLVDDFDPRLLGRRGIFIDHAIHPSLEDAVKLARGLNTRWVDLAQGLAKVHGRELLERPFGEAVRSCCGVGVHTFRHNDIQGLKEMLEANEGEGSYDHRFIAVDGFYSAEGDMAPLREIAELAEKHNAIVIVDDAHGSLVLGENGRGTAEELGVEDKIHFPIHSLSKAGGVRLAFYAGPEDMVRYLRTARSYMFHGASSPAIVAGALAALRISRVEPWRREKLLENGAYLASGLWDLGYDVRGKYHIISWVIGDERKADAVYHDLMGEGIFAPALRYPSVPRKQAIIRFFLTCMHEKEHLDKTIEACKRVGGKHGVC